eukprot:3686606-Alexandrium_andersonii.AAC.1
MRAARRAPRSLPGLRLPGIALPTIRTPVLPLGAPRTGSGLSSPPGRSMASRLLGRRAACLLMTRATSSACRAPRTRAQTSARRAVARG